MTTVPATPDSTLVVVDPVGLPEIGIRLGVARKTAEIWQGRYPEFPKPEARAGGSPIWSWANVAAWARATNRLAPEEPANAAPSTVAVLEPELVTS